MKISLYFALVIDGLSMCSVNPIFLAKPDGCMCCVVIFTVLIEFCPIGDYQSTFKNMR